MSDTRERSIATVQALQRVRTIDVDVLVSRIGQLRTARTNRSGDLVAVAAQVQRLGLAIERVQQR